jgi:hypothetical protein
MCSASESQAADSNLGLTFLRKWGKAVAGKTSLVDLRRDPPDDKICDTCFSSYQQICSQHQDTANGSETTIVSVVVVAATVAVVIAFLLV